MRLSVVFLVAVAALAAAADDCKFEKGEPHGWQCCKIEKGTAPSAFRDGIKKCVAKNPPPPKPTGSGPPDETVMKEMRQAMECSAECVFDEAGLLTSDKKMLDKAAVAKAFKGVAAGNKELEALVETSLEKCFASYAAEVDSSAKCKTGAMQIEKCIIRDGFLNCPRSMWNSSDECGKLKAKITKCPNIPVMLMPPPTAS